MDYKLIYEVNLEVEESVRRDFMAWLKSHVQEILALDGFVGAQIFERDSSFEGIESQGYFYLTTHYYLEDRPSLSDYLSDHASRMRDDGIRSFGGKFSAERRVLIKA